MKRRYLATFVIIAMLMTVLSGCVNESEETKETPILTTSVPTTLPPTTSPEEPDFVITRVDRPSEVIIGEQIKIEVYVSNNGGEGEENISIMINGEKYEKSLWLEKLESEIVEFLYETEKEGTVHVEVGSIQMDVKVIPEPPDFIVKSLKVPSEITNGKRANFQVEVKNEGGDGEDEISLRVGVGGNEETQLITMSAKETILVTFSFIVNLPAKYIIDGTVPIVSGMISEKCIVVPETLIVNRTKDCTVGEHKFSFTITEYEECNQYRTTYGTDYIAVDGGTFIWIYIIAKNLSTEEDDLFSNVYLQYGNDMYDAGTLKYVSIDDVYDNGEDVRPGGTVRGWLVFEVPKNIDLAETTINMYKEGLDHKIKDLIYLWRVPPVPAERLPPPPKEWHVVKTFSGSNDRTTETFYVGIDWRIRYKFSGNGVMYMFAYPKGETAIYVGYVSCDGRCSDTTYIYEGGSGFYYLYIISCYGSWTFYIEDYY